MNTQPEIKCVLVLHDGAVIDGVDFSECGNVEFHPLTKKFTIQNCIFGNDPDMILNAEILTLSELQK